MKLGGLFGRSSTASKPKALPDKKKKIGIFGVEWPDKPMQQPKDYKVIKKAVELIDYLKRCEETGICGFDYETTVSDEYQGRYSCECGLLTDSVVSGDIDRKEYEERLESLTNDFLKSPLDPWKAQICTVSLSAAPHEARVVFIDNPGFNQFEGLFKYDTHSVRELVMQILNEHLFRNKKINKVAVNLSFETKHTAKHGMYIMEPCSDPFLMWVRCLQVANPKAIADPKKPASGKGLKEITKQYLGVTMSETGLTPEIIKEAGGNTFLALLKKHGVQFFSEISADHPDALVYSAEDADYAVQQYYYWCEVAKQIPKYYDWLHTIEMPFARVIGLMEYWGLSWDSQLASSKRLEAVEMRDGALAEIIKLGEQFGEEILPGKTGKTGSVKHFLFDVLGCPTARLSEKTGDPSMDEEAIIDMRFMVEHKLDSLDEEEWLTEGHPRREVIQLRQEYANKEDIIQLLGLIQKVQTYTTLLSSHIDGRQKFVNSVSGRIHSGYSSFTETGRLNSFSPNQQNCSREPVGAVNVRDFYQAEPGKVLFLVDESGFELRLMAWKSGDETMTEAFVSGDGDLHRITASTITGKPRHEVTKAERSRAKAPNFLISYGGTEHALRANLKKDYGVRETLDECAKLIEAVKTTYPRIPEFQRNIALEARELGYVQDIYGYIRLLPYINSPDNRAKRGDERKAANTPIQGSAASIMKRCQNEAYELMASNPEYGKRARLVAQIHDKLACRV